MRSCYAIVTSSKYPKIIFYNPIIFTIESPLQRMKKVLKYLHFIKNISNYLCDRNIKDENLCIVVVAENNQISIGLVI